jgi:2-polyprenyl-3-methyl-5-hydroxy-6-metoxy-1,4-benzoquinol methylase
MGVEKAKSFYWEDFVMEVNSKLFNGATVLDAGAGDGAWQKKILHAVNYISMDLGVGDNTLDYSHLHIKGDLSKIPLDSNSIDVVICIQVLEHVKEPWTVLSEFYRVLKPGGILYLTCPQGVPLHQEPFDFYRYTKHGLQYLMQKSGFALDWIRAQQGDIVKISNDIKLLSNDLKLNGYKISGFFMQLLGTCFRVLFKKLDHEFTLNTTGYFVKATKPNGE